MIRRKLAVWTMFIHYFDRLKSIKIMNEHTHLRAYVAWWWIVKQDVEIWTKFEHWRFKSDFGFWTHIQCYHCLVCKLVHTVPVQYKIVLNSLLFSIEHVLCGTHCHSHLPSENVPIWGSWNSSTSNSPHWRSPRYIRVGNGEETEYDGNDSLPWLRYMPFEIRNCLVNVIRTTELRYWNCSLV